MFAFFSRKGSGEKLDFSTVKVDMHSHLIPGIDDGAKDMENSIELILALKGMGFTKLITTPHIYKEYYPNTSQIIREGLENVKKELKNRNIDIEIHAAAEYFMDDHFEQLLDQNDILTLDGRHVLVEMSFYGASPKLFQYLFKIQTKGYIPIIAHPERYGFVAGDLSVYKSWKAAGALLQMNLLSYIGYYGPMEEKTAKKLLDAGLYDLVGTDLHHLRHQEGLEKMIEKKVLSKLFQDKIFKNIELFS
jgi:protein-tyrosine phosphatase